MNMNTELLDDTLDEIFEETGSEDYNENESEMEELETEVSEDTEKWADDGDLKKIPFEGNPGPNNFTFGMVGPEASITKTFSDSLKEETDFAVTEGSN
ncbi:hypothetical protein AVEN_203191-1 [Araneus ventricosus]|uniref:Uncharacterized protein n=1 Tax=Araneus ventricosus TaxID=182803 RepID=A0A4Y2CI58_ARAVE|nr:hypothetical protein AVEN_203191-1 [Araneus ventricosus]